MLDYLKRLFGYDHWANRQALRSLRGGQPTPRSLKLIAHIGAAERLWMDRLLAQPQRMAVWPALTLEQSEALLEEMAQAWNGYIEALSGDGLAVTIAYTNTRGERWTNTVEDVLMHVIIHSGYHRGQIAADVRASGHEPAYTDFIEAMRRGHVKA
jgi:uncharacterized damage-inducible protein DinB